MQVTSLTGNANPTTRIQQRGKNYLSSGLLFLGQAISSNHTSMITLKRFQSDLFSRLELFGLQFLYFLSEDSLSRNSRIYAVSLNVMRRISYSKINTVKKDFEIAKRCYKKSSIQTLIDMTKWPPAFRK